MGIYLNPGNRSFTSAVASEIFVDKTPMLQCLNEVVNTNQRYISVSRPRRFGKTMAADMICAYYDQSADSRNLFNSLKIHSCPPSFSKSRPISWDEYLGGFDVIRIVMTDFINEEIPMQDILHKMQKLVIRELVKAYPDVDYFDPDDLIQTMSEIYAESGHQFVIVIDEVDAVFRARIHDASGQRQYLDFLRAWLKDKDYIALAYITGILPIKKYGEHSALNMFTEYSMLSSGKLASYTGFTEQEVEALCRQYHMSYEEISDWYDGYLLSDSILPEDREDYREGIYAGHRISIYSPLSVVESMLSGQIKNYWNKTETYEALAEYIRKDYDGLKEAVALLIDGGRITVDTSTYQNDMTTFNGRDDILSLLIHLGYLGFDDERSEVFVPNREILAEFKTSTKSREWDATFTAFENSRRLLDATWAGDEEQVASLLEEFHNNAENKTYNSEAALSYAIQLAYYSAEKYYTKIPELDAGKGYADIAYLPAPEYADKPAILVELKYNKDADSAITQIHQQKYPARLEHYKGNLILVGINYDPEIRNNVPEFKHHSCKIERA